MNKDIEIVKKLLPKSYTVKKGKNEYSIHCISKTGIFKKITTKDGNKGEAEDDEHWDYIFKAIKSHFGERFSEVYHETCTHHSDFFICLNRPKTSQKYIDKIRKELFHF